MDDPMSPSPAEEMPPPPREVTELAESCRQYVLKAVGIQLDYTPETLPALDHYLETSRDAVRDRPQLLPLLARSVGAYFGEVLRRHIDGLWYQPSGDIHEWRICATRAFLSINPTAVAYDALHGGPDHAGPSSRLHTAAEDQPIVAQRLQNLPPVSEDEFYRLGTQLEAIEIAVDELRTQMQAGGHEDVVFDESDYADELAQLSDT